MDYKHCCAVDADGYYKAFVLVVEGRVQYYTLKEGESLLDVPPPVLRPHAGAEGLISPRWDGEAWAEGATAGEAAAWEAGHPAPERGVDAAADTDAMLVDHEYRLALLELGVEGEEMTCSTGS